MPPKAPKAPKPKTSSKSKSRIGPGASATTGPCPICDQPWHLIADCSFANSGRARAEAALANLAPGLTSETLEAYIEKIYPQDQSDHEEQSQEHNQMAQEVAQLYNVALTL